MDKMVLYHSENRVGYITLNRPEKRNAMNAAFVGEIKETFKQAEANDNCKLIVLKANGDAFCAGADLSYLQSLQTNTYDENLQDSQHLMELFRMIHLSSKVVIAQIEGPAMAGGCGLATVCDFSFATPESTFAYTEVKIGFIPAIVMVFLIRKIGEGKAREILLTGDIFSAEKAQNYGLVNFVKPADAIENEVKAFAERLCKTASAQSLKTVKEMIAGVQDSTLDEALMYAAKMNAAARATDDCKKGIAAFLNKEKLTW
ncbi:MAG: enoyl-CoA hydratase/isomerase family protein [Bacteroidia bacterium]|jgi:methylglutaconyl-CoA hydratase|nr:enoyl-CoA hydratase/isomerase family protein [Bacteroidia bacterium]